MIAPAQRRSRSEKKTAVNSYTNRVKEEEEPEGYSYNLPEGEIEIIDAPLWKRLAAYLIDTVFFYFVFFQIFIGIYISSIGIPLDAGYTELSNYLATHPVASGKVLIGFFGAAIVYLFYFTMTEKEFGTTLGKWVMKLRVVSLSGNSLSYSQALVRNLTKTVLLPLLPIDALGVLITKEKQGFSDIITGTRVIYRGELGLEYEGMY
jgi:uncharacterized RDD family membrane protein YckC